MQPTNLDRLGQVREHSIRRIPPHPQDPAVTRSLSGIRRLRSDESWIEVSSQPSSSSLSSIAADDGALPSNRIQHAINARRRRRLHRSISVPLQEELHIRPRSATGSSQEEYEESESESDRLMSSSNEELAPHFLQDESPPIPASSASENAPSEEEDDADNTTALGITNHEPVFTPQPNAFSHPPVSSSSRQSQPTAIPGSYFPIHSGPSARLAAQRHSYPSQCNRYDDALRASLSTLLSCAAAARALPKHDNPTAATPATPSNRIEPSTLRLVPESAMASPPTPPLPPRRASSGKRKSCSRDRRIESKKKQKRAFGEDVMISPTLLTWVMGAGVVVLFSAISFSAGYVYGREVGRLEGVTGMGGGSGCAREVGRGGGSWRRLRWGNGSLVRV